MEGRGTGENQALEEWFSRMFNSSTHPGVQLDKGQREGARMAWGQAPRDGLGAGISVIYLSAEMTASLMCEAVGFACGTGRTKNSSLS